MVRSRSWSSLLALALLPLLGLLAFLQFRWIDEAAKFEHRRLQAALTSAARTFGEALKADIRTLDTALDPAGDWRTQDFREPLARLRGHPRLGAAFQGCFRLESGGSRAWRLDEATGRFTPLPEIPAPLLAPGLPRDGFAQGTLNGRPALFRVLPLVDANCEPRKAGRVEVRQVLQPATLWVSLDGDAFTGRALPALLREIFGSLGDDFALELADGAGRALATLGTAPKDTAPDLSVPLSLPSPLERLLPPGSAAAVMRGASDAQPTSAGWSLHVTHRSGSSANVMTRLRTRNLALSLGILGVLAAGLAVLVDAARRARHLAMRERQFVASVSHELKTPLAVVLSAGENLAAGIVTEPASVARYGQTIHAEGLRLREMIDKILGFSRLESRARYEGQETFDPEATLDAVLARLAPLAERCGAAFHRSPGPGNVRLRGRRTDLEALLENLLGNALKHGAPQELTPEWNITLVTSQENGRWSCIVADLGPGIPRGERHRIFAPFRRGDRAEAEQVPGSGLGLAIARECAHSLGGEVRLDNPGEAGARFRVSLPVVVT